MICHVGVQTLPAVMMTHWAGGGWWRRKCQPTISTTMRKVRSDSSKWNQVAHLLFNIYWVAGTPPQQHFLLFAQSIVTL